MMDEEEEEEEGESYKEDLSLREDLGINARHGEESPAREDQNRVAVQTKVSSFVKEYESCEGMQSEAKPKKPRQSPSNYYINKTLIAPTSAFSTFS